MKNFLRIARLFCSGTVAFLLSLAIIGPAAADTYPSKTVTIVVPYPAGGLTDVVARLISNKLSQMWHSSVIVENRPGASGMIGTNEVTKAHPDGYTLLLTSAPSVTIVQSLYKRISYDPKKDLSPIILTATSPLVWAASPQSGIKSFSDVKALAEKGSVNFATSGVASVHRMAGALMISETGLHLTEIPYKGGAPALSAVLAGHVQTAFEVAPLVVPYIQDKRLNAIAVTSSERIEQLPNVPTMDEAIGTKGFDLQNWYGMFAPQGTPTAVVQKVNRDVLRILQMPDIKERIEKLGGIPKGESVAEFKEFWVNEINKFKAIIDKTHMKKL